MREFGRGENHALAETALNITTKDGAALGEQA